MLWHLLHFFLHVRFDAPWLGLLAVLLVVSFTALRFFWYKPIQFNYALTALVAKQSIQSSYYRIVSFIWMGILLLLALVVAKPQWVDYQSRVVNNGIDIMLALDASGSMQMRDFADDRRMRFEIAQDEAVRFVNKRINDAIGLVFFARDAFTRLPLTFDKNVLKTTISALKLGDIDPQGTVLAKAILTAINRIKNSQAKSKVIILLTDGEPSSEDIDPRTVVDIAKKYQVKIYTIGIGSEKDELLTHAVFGLMRKPKINAALLQFIAHQTNGQFFRASNKQDMRAVYDKIDELETTKKELPHYTRYVDLYIPFVIIALVGIVALLIITTFIWFML